MRALSQAFIDGATVIASEQLPNGTFVIDLGSITSDARVVLFLMDEHAALGLKTAAERAHTIMTGLSLP